MHRSRTVALLLLLALPGCAANKGTVGDTFLHDAAMQEGRNTAAPVKIGLRTSNGAVTDADGSVFRNAAGDAVVTEDSILAFGTGPGFVSVTSARETRAIAPNTVIRSLSFTPDPSTGKYVLNLTSGTDMKATATADEFAFDPATFRLTGRNLNASFETIASAPFRVSNESLAAWAEAVKTMTPEQAAVFRKQLEAQVSAGGQIGDFAAAVLKAAFPVP